jgi:hypothetical protein
MHTFMDWITVHPGPTAKVFDLHPAYTNPDPSMARQDALSVDSEHVTCGLSADYKLSLAGVGGADNAFWSVKGD